MYYYLRGELPGDPNPDTGSRPRSLSNSLWRLKGPLVPLVDMKQLENYLAAFARASVSNLSAFRRADC